MGKRSSVNIWVFYFVLIFKYYITVISHHKHFVYKFWKTLALFIFFPWYQHYTLSIKCKYILFYPYIPCLKPILTNSIQNIIKIISFKLYYHVYLNLLFPHFLFEPPPPLSNHAMPSTEVLSYLSKIYFSYLCIQFTEWVCWHIKYTSFTSSLTS